MAEAAPVRGSLSKGAPERLAGLNCSHVGNKRGDIADVHFRVLPLATVWIMLSKRTGNHV